MSWVVIALMIVFVLVVVIVKLSQKQGALPTDYPYRKIEALFSPAERSFLGVLNQVVGDNAQIFGKVRVADVITPNKGISRSDWQKSFNKISGKHFDFLLCNKNDLSVLCAIELNDSFHNSKKQKDRDTFLKGACQSADVPLIRIAAQATYSINEMQQSLAAYLPGSPSSASTQDSVTEIFEHISPGNEKVCPKCSSKMVKKIAKKGKNIGKEFWACSGFPKCRYIEAINA